MTADKYGRGDNSDFPKGIWVGALVIGLTTPSIAYTPLYFVVCSLIYFIFSRKFVLDRIYSERKGKIQPEIDQYEILIAEQKKCLAHIDDYARAEAARYVREHPPISPESITSEMLADEYKLAYYSDSNLPRPDTHVSADELKEFR